MGRAALLLPSNLMLDARPALWLDPRALVSTTRVNNGGFEAAGAGGADVFANWTEGTGGTSTVNDETEAMDSGAHCCRFDVDASSSAAYVQQGAMTVGQTYTIRFRAKASAACTMQMSSSSPATSYTLTTSWTTYETTFVAANANMILGRLTAPSKSIYVDNVSLWQTTPTAVDAKAVPQWSARKRGTKVFSQISAGAQPTYDAVDADQNNQPTLTFDGGDYLRLGSAALMGTAGRFLAVVKTTATDAEQVVYSQANESTADQYLKLGISASNKIWYKFDNGAGVTAVELAGNADLGTDYHVLEWVSDGSAITMFVDGSAQSLTVVGGTNAGQWFGDVTGADNSILGASQTTSVSGYLTGSLSEVVAFEPDKTGYARRVRSALSSRYAVTLAAAIGLLMADGSYLLLADGSGLLMG